MMHSTKSTSSSSWQPYYSHDQSLCNATSTWNASVRDTCATDMHSWPTHSSTESATMLWYQSITTLLPHLPKQLTIRGKHEMREVTKGFNFLRDLKEIESMKHISKPIDISKNNLWRHVSHSNILSMTPTDVLKFLSPGRSHAIGMTVSRSQSHTQKPMCQEPWTLFQ